MPDTNFDRERRLNARMEDINRIECVVGRADRSRVDREGTMLERARRMEAELRAHESSEAGLAAFDRLVQLAQEKSSPHWRAVADFLQALREGGPLPLGLLRLPAQPVADDMIAALDAWRIARLDLVSQVPGGAQRVARALSR